MLREALRGRRIAITGATGFLGTALVERILRTIPDSEVALLVRPGRRGAADRVRREVLKNSCFDRLRRELGPSFDAEVARRVRVLAGDVGADGLGLDAAGEELLASCPTVIHSAATVSFDSPLDTAVEINLLGPVRVAAALNRLHQRGDLPHLIAISTAYVAGSRRGRAPEATLPDTPWSTEVAWRGEVDAARRARADADAASRDPKRLARLHRQARHELGAAGGPLLAAKTERLREDWVKNRLVDLGKSRAQGLGWPDAYAYTKSLGERALLETRGALPVTIVRPSIIESALAEPTPGWIRGFRMADPVIISYAKGLLKNSPEFPRASLTSYLWIWWWQPFSPSSPAVRSRNRTCCTPLPARVTRCGTASWSSWYAPGFSNTRWPMTRISPSPFRNGHSPAVTGSSGSSARRPGPWAAPRRPCSRFPCVVGKRI